jgi:hypothetical protein
MKNSVKILYRVENGKLFRKALQDVCHKMIYILLSLFLLPLLASD